MTVQPSPRHRRRRIVVHAVILLSWFAAGVLAVANPHGIRDQPSASVLFIGNSYTYFNNLPEMFAALATEAGHHTRVTMAAPGGWRLKDHWEKGEALGLLRTQHWDYVVLQEQSTLGVNYYVEGRTRVAGDELFRPYATRWASEVRNAGATPVFYLTWAPRDAPEDQRHLDYAYFHAASESDAVVTPAGWAWSLVRQHHPEIKLFHERGSHPSPAGTYLVACTLFATVFDQTPVGLPSKIEGHPVNLQTEKAELNETVPLVDLPLSEAEILQSSAWTAHQKLNRQREYPNLPKPPLPNVEPLPRGLPLKAIAGDWTGTISFFPVGPVDMLLHLEGEPVQAGRLELKYHSKNFADESIRLEDLRINGRSISFSDAKSIGVDGLMIRFRGVRIDQYELRGTAETRVDRVDSPLRIIGAWRLRR